METMTQRVLWGRDTEITLIHKIREYRILWDQRDPLFTKKSLKNAAYNEVAWDMSETFPKLGALTGECVRLKFANLKNYFKRELRKRVENRNDSEEIGSGKWDLYDYLTFLEEGMSVELTTSSFSMNGVTSNGIALEHSLSNSSALVPEVELGEALEPCSSHTILDFHMKSEVVLEPGASDRLLLDLAVKKEVAQEPSVSRLSDSVTFEPCISRVSENGVAPKTKGPNLPRDGVSFNPSLASSSTPGPEASKRNKGSSEEHYSSTTQEPGISKRKRRTSEESSSLKVAIDSLSRVLARREDKYTYFGLYISEVLRELPESDADGVISEINNLIYSIRKKR